jgi:hypothetical protein
MPPIMQVNAPATPVDGPDNSCITLVFNAAANSEHKLSSAVDNTWKVPTDLH